MMSEFVDRKDVIKAVMSVNGGAHYISKEDTISEILSIPFYSIGDNKELEELKSYIKADGINKEYILGKIDLIQKTKKGIWDNKSEKSLGGNVCSVCGKTARGIFYKTDFCPNCGADMRDSDE